MAIKIASREALGNALRSSDKGTRKSVLEALENAFEKALEQGGGINEDALDELYSCYCGDGPDQSWYAYLLLKLANKYSLAVSKQEFLLARSSQYILLASIFIVRLPEAERVAFLSPFVLDSSNTTRCRAAANMLDDCFSRLPADVALRAALVSDHKLPAPMLDGSNLDIWLNELEGPYPSATRKKLLEKGASALETLLVSWERLPVPVAAWALQEATDRQLNIAAEKVVESLGSDPEKTLILAALECYKRLTIDDESLLGHYFRHEDPDVRAAAITAGRSGDKWHFRYEQETTEKVRLVILDKIKASRNAQSIGLLMSCLEDKSWRIRARAADGLVAVGAEAVEPLKTALLTEDKSVKTAVVSVLYRLGQEDWLTDNFLDA